VSADDFAVDEFGRFYLCDEEGNLYSGPYDTLEEAEAAMADAEAAEQEE